MFAKLLKRYNSRTAIIETSQDPIPPLPMKTEEVKSIKNDQENLPIQYRYQRPDVIGHHSQEDLTQFSSHGFRPVVPGIPAVLPDGVGYAEVINAGKSRYNEDQASFLKGELVGKKGTIKYLYIGIFDGHGGPGAAIKAMKEMHQIVHEGLEDVLDYLQDPNPSPDLRLNTTKHHTTNGIEEVTETLPHCNGLELTEEMENEFEDVRMSRDELVCGALESAFWAMDRLISKDKQNYRISGGACALVSLFIFDKLYVANAGDSRACVYLSEEPHLRQMSHDFSPDADRQRIQMVAYQRPELLRHPVTNEKMFNRHILSRTVTEADIGKPVLYKDFYMTGWSCRDVIPEDTELLPIISGRGKQCRLLATMGVARGIGDHDLVVRTALIKCKDFLTCQPEVRIMELDEILKHDRSYLILATDGYWDVISNDDTRDLMDKLSQDSLSDCDIAQQLVLEARGDKVPDQYWEKKNGEMASGDDITIILADLKKMKSYID